MLSIDFNARKNVTRKQFGDLPVLFAHERWIRDSALNQILTLCRTIGTRTKGDLGSAANHPTHHPSMSLMRILTDGFQVEHVSQTLDDRGLPSTTPTDQNVQIRVEVDGSPIQESSFPRKGTEFCMLFKFRITFEPYP